MSQELVYTSAPTGLKPGSKGFCTVAMTAGLPAAWVDRLELLSAYRAVYPLGDPNSQRNPVNFSHWRLVVAGKSKSVLSRLAFAGADYSGRSNKLAHHLVLEPAEQAAGGPAWMLLKTGLMRTTWTGAAQQFPTGPKLPAGDRAPGVCAAWASALGDAGWAGVLAESFTTAPSKPVYLIYSPGTDVLRMFDESLSLLPPAKRWEVTFSTFFTELPLNLTCAWRGAVAGTPAATEALRLGPRALVLDLTKPAEAPPTGAYADAARAGSGPVVTGATPRTAAVSDRPTPAIVPPVDPEDSDIFESPFQNESADVSSLRGRKRLTTADNSDDLESEIQMGVLVEDADTFQSPRQVVVYRGVRGWVFTVSIIGCLVLGVAGAGVTYFLMHKRFQSTQNAAALAQQQLRDAGKDVEAAKNERALAESAQSNAEAAKTDALRIETAGKGHVNDLQKKIDDLGTENGQLQAEKSNLTGKLSDSEGREKAANVQIASLQETIAQVKAEVAAKQNGGEATGAGDGETPANAVPFGPSITKFSFPDGFNGEDPRTQITLPATCTAPVALSVLWPNGNSGFTVKAGNGSKYQLSEKAVSPTKLSIQTLLPTGTGMAPRDIFSLEIIRNQLTVTEKKSDNDSTKSAEAATQTALEDSAFLITSKSGETNKTYRFSLKRSFRPVDADNVKNLFSKPNLPDGVGDQDLRFDGTSKGWQPSPDGTASLFTCELSPNRRAQFSVALSSPFGKLCQINVDISAFDTLKQQRVEADKQKTDAEIAANAADAKLNGIKKGNTDAIKKATADQAQAESVKQTKEGEANQLDSLESDWRNKYEALGHAFPLILRLPNGVEVMHMDIGLPPLSKD